MTPTASCIPRTSAACVILRSDTTCVVVNSQSGESQIYTGPSVSMGVLSISSQPHGTISMTDYKKIKGTLLPPNRSWMNAPGMRKYSDQKHHLYYTLRVHCVWCYKLIENYTAAHMQATCRSCGTGGMWRHGECTAGACFPNVPPRCPLGCLDQRDPLYDVFCD